MPIKTLIHNYWKLIAWSLAAAGLNLLLLLPLPGTMAALDLGGAAFAQTGPPDDTATPIPTATPTHTPTSTPTNTPTSVPTNTPISQSNTDSTSSLQTSNQAQSETSNQNNQTPTATFTPFPIATLTPTPVVAATDTPPSTPLSEAAEPFSTVDPAAPLSASEASTPKLVTGNPPPGIPPLIYSGDIYRILADSNGAGVSIPYTLSNDSINVSLTIPASPAEDKIVRLEEVPATDVPALPAGLEPLIFFNLDVYLINEASGTTELKIHLPALTFSSAAINITSDEKILLLRYDESAQQYEFLPQEYDPVNGILNVLLPKTSLFALAKDAGYSTQPTVADTAPSTQPQPSTPQVAPATSTRVLWWLFPLILAGFTGAMAIFLWLGGGSFVRIVIESASDSLEAETQNRAGGIVLAFALPLSDKQALIKATLALLPLATSLAETTPSQEPISTGLNIASAEAFASIKPLRPDVLGNYNAVNSPHNIHLVSWNETKIQPYKLSRAVFAGSLTWRNPDDEVFARLQDLQTNDVLEVTHQNVSRYRYVVESVRAYQTDNSSVIQITQSTPDAQVVIIAWSEAYDIDRRLYRDYIVVQAHFSNQG